MIKAVVKKILKIIASIFSKIVDLLFFVISVFFIIYLAFTDPHEVDGESMFPTLLNGEFLLTLKPEFKPKYHVGDIIIFHPPNTSCDDCEYVKRIIAGPGDRIEIKDSHIYVNNQLINETYLPSFVAQSQYLFDLKYNLNNNQYFVMGDNRNNSRDSRDFGPIEGESITGTAFIRVWPMAKVSSL